jgi:hypothetical protein
MVLDGDTIVSDPRQTCQCHAQPLHCLTTEP